MAFIHCCSGLRKCRSFILEPVDGFVFSQMLFLEKCPECGHTKLCIVRVSFDNSIESFTKSNEKARKFFDRLKSDILFEEKVRFNPLLPSSNFYLKYNEYGKTKKCFSNLRTLKLGQFGQDDSMDSVYRRIREVFA